MPAFLSRPIDDGDLISRGFVPSRTHSGYDVVWLAGAAFLVCRECGGLVPPFEDPRYLHDEFHSTHPATYYDED